MKKFSFYSIGVLCMTLAGCTVFSRKNDRGLDEYTKDVKTVVELFATSPAQIEEQRQYACDRAQREIAALIAVPEGQQAFDNSFGAYDKAHSHFLIASSRISVLQNVSPDEGVRNAAQQASLVMSEFAIDLFGQNVALYQALKRYAEESAQHEDLSLAQRYFIEESLKGFKRAGLELPDEERAHVARLKKQLSALSIEFAKNIADEARFVVVAKEELEGLEDDFIEALQKTEDGKYRLGVDYPTYFTVLEFCAVGSTRKKLYELFNNRAYPQNKQILEDIVSKRDELARLLGYPSYAHLNLDDEMVKSPERAQEFIDALLPKAQEKERHEFEVRTKDLPASVILSSDGKMYPWDGAFVSAYYKKKYYDLDERLVAEYFPMEATLQGLFNIYTSFFDIDMEHEAVSGLWHEDVSLIKVYRKADRQLLGYLFLDLHPRPNKYTHACEITIVPATKEHDGSINPAVAVVLANFPKSTPNKPSLLKRTDVTTFFHEFGHAIHTILGATEIISFSGTDVKTDFVEMPSQMLEYWLFDRDILKMVSKHYKTGEPLPDHLIDAIIEIKNLTAGATVTRQLFYALLSLGIYGPGSQKDLDELIQRLWKKSLLFSVFDSDDHLYASFGHLTGYGARYYGYMWSKVFAADLFYHIKPLGLMNPEIGKVYAHKILAPGGSVDPNEMLRDFLGREPNEEAFLEDLGL